MREREKVRCIERRTIGQRLLDCRPVNLCNFRVPERIVSYSCYLFIESARERESVIAENEGKKGIKDERRGKESRRESIIPVCVRAMRSPREHEQDRDDRKSEGSFSTELFESFDRAEKFLAELVDRFP